jgi:hypothetical protein
MPVRQVDDPSSTVVTVADLLRAVPDLRVLVAGRGPRTPVRWVHVSELVDPTPYLRGQELLLTAGVHLPKSAAATVEYVARLAHAGVVGLGFGVHPVYRKVPPRLVAACATQDLLLLEVPPSVPFVAVSEAHVNALEEARLRATELVARAQRGIVAAAARPDPLQAVVNAVGSHLAAAVVLVAPAEGSRWSSGPTVPDVEDVIDDLLSPGRERMAVAVHEPGRHVIAQLLEVAARPMVLAVTSSTQLPPATHGLVNTAATVISLVAGHVSTARLGAIGAAVARAALGDDQGSLERSVSQALRLAPGAQWRVLACAPASRLARPDDQRRWQEHFAGSVRTVLRLYHDDVAVAVIPERARPQDVATSLGPDPVGLSEPCAWTDLPTAARQARRRLAAARTAAGGSTVSEQRALRLRDLVDQQAAQGLSAALLAPILDRPDPEATALVTTLHAWLADGGHWDRTAASLGVHRNTVRNRVAKAAKLLGRDLDRASVRVELWLALEWHHGGDRLP